MLCRVVDRKKIKMIINQFSQLSSSMFAESRRLIFLLFISARDNFRPQIWTLISQIEILYLKVVFITKLIVGFIYFKNIHYITRQQFVFHFIHHYSYILKPLVVQSSQSRFLEEFFICGRFSLNTMRRARSCESFRVFFCPILHRSAVLYDSTLNQVKLHIYTNEVQFLQKSYPLNVTGLQSSYLCLYRSLVYVT